MKEQNIESKLLSYRNAYYQGQIKLGKRQGKGVLIMDDGLIIVGSWKNDQLFGNALAILNNDEFAFLQFNRGELEGYCYMRSGSSMLIIDFNNGKPIEKQLLANFEEKTIKISSYRNNNFQLLETFDIQEEQTEERIIERYLKIKYECLSVQQYFKNSFCDEGCFEIKYLANNYRLFKYNDKSNPISLGFVLGREHQIVNYGSYINDKLHGFGCKYENSVKYEGIFENGFLNGYGFKLSNNKYSFGKFQNGSLVQALYLQQRSNTSEEKLRELKRLEHLKSVFYFNAYIKQNLVKFKGIRQINFGGKFQQQQFLYPQNSSKKSNQSNNNINMSLLLSKGRSQKFDDLEIKSVLHSNPSKRFKNPEQYQNMSQASIKSNKTYGISSLQKFNL